MPIFEYQCRRCEHCFEELVLDSSKAIACPACGSREVRKCPSLFAHKSDAGFKPSSGSTSCSGCTASTCTGCSSK
ncbi:MAG: zinc ribbon domain-containing protein [Deltaproteobacteria bacterium]|nr:zinc ribbon domain-containing protein [Deltaproteobacteria bacterium]